MTGRCDPKIVQSLLQQGDRSASCIVARIALGLKPRTYSLICAPNDLAELRSIKGHGVKNELARYASRIKHDQMGPEVRRFMDDTALEGVLVDRNEGECAFASLSNIRKCRRHSKASSHSGSTCSSVLNLGGKSLTKHEFSQPRCEHFPIGDISDYCADTTLMPAGEFAAAETMLREARVELIRISEPKPPVARRDLQT